MDRDNLRDLLALAPDDEAPTKVRLLREFDPTRPAATSTCPTRTTAATRGFEDVLDLVEAACRGLLDELRAPTRV